MTVIESKMNIPVSAYMSLNDRIIQHSETIQQLTAEINKKDQHYTKITKGQATLISDLQYDLDKTRARVDLLLQENKILLNKLEKLGALPLERPKPVEHPKMKEKEEEKTSPDLMEKMKALESQIKEMKDQQRDSLQLTPVHLSPDMSYFSETSEQHVLNRTMSLEVNHPDESYQTIKLPGLSVTFEDDFENVSSGHSDSQGELLRSQIENEDQSGKILDTFDTQEDMDKSNLNKVEEDGISPNSLRIKATLEKTRKALEDSTNQRENAPKINSSKLVKDFQELELNSKRITQKILEKTLTCSLTAATEKNIRKVRKEIEEICPDTRPPHLNTDVQRTSQSPYVNFKNGDSSVKSGNVAEKIKVIEKEGKKSKKEKKRKRSKSRGNEKKDFQHFPDGEDDTKSLVTNATEHDFGWVRLEEDSQNKPCILNKFG